MQQLYTVVTVPPFLEFQVVHTCPSASNLSTILSPLYSNDARARIIYREDWKLAARTRTLSIPFPKVSTRERNGKKWRHFDRAIYPSIEAPLFLRSGGCQKQDAKTSRGYYTQHREVTGAALESNIMPPSKDVCSLNFFKSIARKFAEYVSPTNSIALSFSVGVRVCALSRAEELIIIAARWAGVVHSSHLLDRAFLYYFLFWNG
jgi:hypothetical protein